MEQKFEYNSLPVRTVTDGEDQTWFAGIDVCDILEYSNANNIIKKLLDEDERKLEDLTDLSGQKRKTWIINESGLYSLALSSTKPEAKVFKRWVTHNILPAIRKAGKFTTEQEKEYELSLKVIVQTIEKLKEEREGYLTAANDLKKEIEKEIAAMIDIIKSDRSQLKLPFPES